MDKNEYEDCIIPKKKCSRNCGCGEYILGILFVVFATILGLILGSVFAETITTALSALIVFAIMVIILIVIRIISIICKNRY